MQINVALAQIQPATGDKDANIEKIGDFLARAAGMGAQLVVFPELALTGYACGDAFFEVAEEVPGPRTSSTARIAALARAHGLHVIWGMPERGLAGVIYNAAVIVGPEGHIGTWRKHTLPGHATDQGGPGAFPDRRFFRAGNRSPVFETPLGRIGMMVCYDIFFPEISRLLTLKGADLLVGISGSPAFERPIFEPLVRARAMENTNWFAYCNMAGTEGDVAYWGGSRIVGPGDPATKVPGAPVVCQAPYDEEALVCGTVDYEATHRFRPLFPVLRDIRTEMYTQLTAAVEDELD
ncbi:MAG: carbon-nitrogen hydrolase family protein [Chloroflexota bacterium]|nr:carbon-nitrogen hydrolase family protein [Chloroflexota bacterium]